jgi:hypothetical protein
MVGHLSHYQSLRLHILDIESSSSSDFSKPELSRTHSSSSLSHGQPASDLEEVLEYDDDIPYDDEADDDSLSLSRCASNFTVPAAHPPPQQQPQRLPDLESDDSDESDHDDYYDEYDGPVSPEDERCPSEAVVVPQISELAISGLYHHRDVRHGRRHPPGAQDFDDEGIWEVPVAQRTLGKGVTTAMGKLAVEVERR